MRRQTWFATLVCTVLVIPAFIVAGVINLIIQSISSLHMDPNSDFLLLRTLFGIEAPSIIINYVFFRLMPAGLHGGIAGALAAWATAKACNGAKVDTAAHITSAIYFGVIVTMSLILAVMKPFWGTAIQSIEAMANVIGLWIGLSVTAQAEMTRTSAIA